MIVAAHNKFGRTRIRVRLAAKRYVNRFRQVAPAVGVYASQVAAAFHSAIIKMHLRLNNFYKFGICLSPVFVPSLCSSVSFRLTCFSVLQNASAMLRGEFKDFSTSFTMNYVSLFLVSKYQI